LNLFSIFAMLATGNSYEATSFSAIEKRKVPQKTEDMTQKTKKMKEGKEELKMESQDLEPQVKSTEQKKDWSWFARPENFEKGMDELEKLKDLSGHFCIGEKVSQRGFLEVLEKVDRTPYRFRWENGKVYIYEIPKAKHEVAAREIVTIIRENRRQSLQDRGNARMTTSTWSREPDGCLFPVGRTGPSCDDSWNNNPWPTLIVEIASAEDLDDLHASAQRWLDHNTQVRMVVGIKIWSTHTNGKVSLLALLYLRANPAQPIQAISFGTAKIHYTNKNWLTSQGIAFTGVGTGSVPCNALGIAQYQLQIPTAELYHGVAVPHGVPTNITVDLYEIQQIIIANM